MLGAVVVVIVW